MTSLERMLFSILGVFSRLLIGVSCHITFLWWSARESNPRSDRLQVYRACGTLAPRSWLYLPAKVSYNFLKKLKTPDNTLPKKASSECSTEVAVVEVPATLLTTLETTCKRKLVKVWTKRAVTITKSRKLDIVISLQRTSSPSDYISHYCYFGLISL
jgi:hypothetical protein